MITIKITNVKEIVKSHKGWVASRFGHLFLDLEKEVEKRVVEQLQAVFEEKNIQAEIEILSEDGKKRHA